jgi:hypothetical protein
MRNSGTAKSCARKVDDLGSSFAQETPTQRHCCRHSRAIRWRGAHIAIFDGDPFHVFGYGLSYTRFVYTNARDEKISILPSKSVSDFDRHCEHRCNCWPCLEGISAREYFSVVYTSKHRDLNDARATEYSVCEPSMLPRL